MGIATASSTHFLAPGVDENFRARSCYVLKADGQYVKGKLFGSEALYLANQKVTSPTSNAKLHCNSRIRSQHTTGLALMVAQEKISKTMGSGLGAPANAGMPRPLTPAQLELIGKDKRLKTSVYSVDSMAAKRTAERFKADSDRLNWTIRWAEARDTVRAGKMPIKLKANDFKPNVDRNGFAGFMAGAGKRWSSVGDAVNAITTMTANSFTAFVGPSKDGDSIKHTVARCTFTLVSLAVLALNGYTLRSIIESIDETDNAEIFNGLEVTNTVGWFWLMPLLHCVAFASQLVSAAAVDRSRDVDVEQVAEAETKKNETLVKTSRMINAIRNDPTRRGMLIEGLNRRVSAKYRTNGVPNVWLKLEKATTPAELQKVIAEFLTEVEPGTAQQMTRFKREYQVLKILKLAENDRTEGTGKVDESGRNRTERLCGEGHRPVGLFFAKTLYRMSGNGKVETVAKLARWIEKQSDIGYQERRKQSLDTAEGRIKHRYHPQVVRVYGGPLSKALVNIGFFVRDFGRNIILSLDTNLARMIRSAVQHLWERVMGSHASMIMSNTFGMIGGWLIVGTALVALSSGMEAVFGAAGAAGMLTTGGAGYGVGYASLTFAYGVFAAAGGVLMLAGMALARAGL